MEYTVVKVEALSVEDERDKTLKEFTQKVSQLLSQGWEPAGGVSISEASEHGWSNFIFTQALIKK